jgi:hypothetical protein
MNRIYAKLAGAVLSVAVLASGCGMLGKNDGGEGGGSACDGKGECTQCTQCAGQEFCKTALANCQQSSACVGLDECLTLCGSGVQCQNDCYSANSQGRALHDTLRECLFCEACPNDCAGFTTCE